MSGQLFIEIFWRRVRIAFRQETTSSRDMMNSWQASWSGDTRRVVSLNHHQEIKYFNVTNYVN